MALYSIPSLKVGNITTVLVSHSGTLSPLISRCCFHYSTCNPDPDKLISKDDCREGDLLLIFDITSCLSKMVTNTHSSAASG